MRQLNIRVEFFEEDGQYVALCPMLNVSSYGETLQEARSSLIEAVEIFIDECSEMGTLEQVLEESGFIKTGQSWTSRQAVSEEQLALAV